MNTRTNSTALYAYNLSPKSMRKKVTENNFPEVMTEIFFLFYENYENINLKIQEAQ